ncbi:hypothetical protein [Bifidobacterium canis]|uniref:Uncharacterized protein n=1 Tax=Bifidobacterium canis TaxID=2610880 RepID=A0A7K1J491_9BIFI|nr:hypothetical protein [Bifidobacterium canis]MUH59349.1 hypothetical protein [Bifidobacterium canis]
MDFKVPQGFVFAGGHVGIKDVNDDIGIAVADKVCSASAMFTKNHFAASAFPLEGKRLPITVCKESSLPAA